MFQALHCTPLWRCLSPSFRPRPRMRTVASDRICNCHQLAVVAVVVAVVLYFIPICCICRNLRTFLGGPNGPKICVRGTKFDFEDWGGGGGGAVLYPVLDNFKTILGQFRISLEQIRDNFKTSLGRWRWRWCCTLSRPRLAPGAVRAAVAGGRHFWAAVLWLVAAWTHPPTYVVAERCPRAPTTDGLWPILSLVVPSVPQFLT